MIAIAADESFEPIIQEEIDVFESLYPLAGIVPRYTTEVEAINLLLKDSVRLSQPVYSDHSHCSGIFRHIIYHLLICLQRTYIARRQRFPATNRIRTLTEEEMNSFHSRKFYPREMKLATDGLALIVNRANPDSLISVRNFRRILTGKVKEWKAVTVPPSI